MLGWLRGAGSRKEQDSEVYSDTVDEYKDSGEIALYMLTERVIPNIIEYAAKCGLPLQGAFSSIEEAKVAMLIETRPARLVIVESGLGKFTMTTTRQELVDLIGLCDVDKRVSIFYTSSLLKSEVQKVIVRRAGSILWYPYKGTLDVFKQTLKLGEKYIKNNVNIRDEEPDYSKLNYVGSRVDTIETEINLKFEESPFQEFTAGEPLAGFDRD